MKDVQNRSDIIKFINAFYAKAKTNIVIGPVFHAAIKEKEWEVHLQRIYDFWEMVLLSQSSYRGDPFSKHIDLSIKKLHFEVWIQLFNETLDQYFEGPNVDLLKDRALKMSEMFQIKLAHKRKNDSYKNNF